MSTGKRIHAFLAVSEMFLRQSIAVLIDDGASPSKAAGYVMCAESGATLAVALCGYTTTTAGVNGGVKAPRGSSDA
jgi:hypothetical protein